MLLLIILKVSVSLLTGSLGILAQAADSVLDMAAAVLAFFAVRVADQPPDAEHPYGHGKVENLAALAEVVLLLITCGWIVYEALHRLFFQPVAIEAGLWGIGVMLLSIGASIWLSTYLMRVARRYQSQKRQAKKPDGQARVGLERFGGASYLRTPDRLGHFAGALDCYQPQSLGQPLRGLLPVRKVQAGRDLAGALGDIVGRPGHPCRGPQPAGGDNRRYSEDHGKKPRGEKKPPARAG